MECSEYHDLATLICWEVNKSSRNGKESRKTWNIYVILSLNVHGSCDIIVGSQWTGRISREGRKARVSRWNKGGSNPQHHHHTVRLVVVSIRLILKVLLLLLFLAYYIIPPLLYYPSHTELSIPYSRFSYYYPSHTIIFPILSSLVLFLPYHIIPPIPYYSSHTVGFVIIIPRVHSTSVTLVVAGKWRKVDLAIWGFKTLDPVGQLAALFHSSLHLTAPRWLHAPSITRVRVSRVFCTALPRDPRPPSAPPAWVCRSSTGGSASGTPASARWSRSTRWVVRLKLVILMSQNLSSNIQSAVLF